MTQEPHASERAERAAFPRDNASDTAGDPQYDFVVVGAGLLGIGLAVHLREAFPDARLAVLEAREAIGGTWDYFRYPGLRSDSDIFTLGYEFKPWQGERSIALGESIRDYIREAAYEHQVDRAVQFGARVTGADWSSATQRWVVEIEDAVAGAPRTLSTRWLFSCAGYFSYEQPHVPEFTGRESFTGPVVHPQHWPEGLDTAGKRIVVIGSGATAFSIVPALASNAEHITILQRSPTYVLRQPAVDGFANLLRRILPMRAGYRLIRELNARKQSILFKASRARPGLVKQVLRRLTARALPSDFDTARHFTPRYDPWHQRMCILADGDVFAAIRDGSVSMVTDRVQRFDETEIVLESGDRLDADVIVTATGMNIRLLGGIPLAIDGSPVVLRDTIAYRNSMLSGVPNFAFQLGYFSASWTLQGDLVSNYLVRLIKHMRERGDVVATAIAPDELIARLDSLPPLVDLLSANWITRAEPTLPRHGDAQPWSISNDWFTDRRAFRSADVTEAMQFDPAPADPRVAAAGSPADDERARQATNVTDLAR